MVVNGTVVEEGQVWEYRHPHGGARFRYKITYIGIKFGTIRGIRVKPPGSGEEFELAMGPKYESGHKYWALVGGAATVVHEWVPW